MSRTDKDRPYWVLMNDEGVVEHDHRGCDHWGRKTRTRYGAYIRDEDGNIVMETVTRYETAEWIDKFAKRTKTYEIEVFWPRTMTDTMRYTAQSRMMTVTGKGVNPLWAEANNLVSQGKGDTKLAYSTSQRPKREVFEEEFNDECDAHLPYRRYRSDLPEAVNCTRSLPASKQRRWCSCDMCEPGGIWAEKRSRTAKKNTLRAMAKAYDGTDDWQDDYEERELYLSRPLRYTSQWC